MKSALNDCENKATGIALSLPAQEAFNSSTYHSESASPDGIPDAAWLGCASGPVPDKPATAGHVLGDYELLDEIARGGMGVVFRARQISLGRTVALKVLDAGPAISPTQIQRFLNGAEKLSKLNHPNLVPIYGFGRNGRQFYLSMELIIGGSLDKHISSDPKDKAVKRSRQLEIAGFMAKVAGAMHFAHQNVILHRDLKPANILVRSTGEPVITDFDLARELGEGDGLTKTRAILGTSSYMSPEQTLGESSKLTVCSDVFSLGAIFYELLTGQVAFQRETDEETRRMVRDEEPQSPRLLNPHLDPDLETVCLKCLEKDPKDRYSSADALAQDLERWTRHEPIRARPSTLVERTIKWTKRRPAVAGLWGLVIVVFLAGASAVLWQWRVSVKQRQTAQQYAQFMRDALDDVVPSLPYIKGPVLLRDYLDRMAGRLGKDLASQPEVQAEMRATLGRIYRDLGAYSNARTQLHAALQYYRTVCPGDHRQTAEILNVLGDVLRRFDRWDDARNALRESVAMTKRIYGANHKKVLEPLNILGLVELDSGQLGPARQIFTEILERAKSVEPQSHRATAMSAAFNNLVGVMRRQGDFTAAEKLMREAIRLERALHGDLHPSLGQFLHNLGLILRETKRLSVAEAPLREALAIRQKLFPEGHPDLLTSLEELATLRRELGDRKEAASLLKQAADLAKVLFGDGFQSAYYLGQARRDEEDWRGAKESFQAAVRFGERGSPPPLSDLIDALNGLADAAVKVGDYAEANAAATRVLELRRKALAPNNELIAISLENLAFVRGHAADSLDAAEGFAREAIALRTNIFGANHPSVEKGYRALAWVLNRKGDRAGAEAARDRAEALKAATPDANQPSPSDLEKRSAEKVEAGELDEAEKLSRRVLALRQAMYGYLHTNVATSFKNLGTVLEKRGDSAGAETCYREALAIRQRLLGEAHLETAFAHQLLGMSLFESGRLDESAEHLSAALAAERVLLKDDPGTLEFYGIYHLAECQHRRRLFAEAENLYGEVIDRWRSRLPPESSQKLVPLMEERLGELYVDWANASRTNDAPSALARAQEGERLLRQCLKKRLSSGSTNDWIFHKIQGCLADALTVKAALATNGPLDSRRAGFVEAEALLMKGSLVLESGVGSKDELLSAVQRLIRLYEAWNKFEPHSRLTNNLLGLRQKVGEIDQMIEGNRARRSFTNALSEAERFIRSTSAARP